MLDAVNLHAINESAVWMPVGAYTARGTSSVFDTGSKLSFIQSQRQLADLFLISITCLDTDLKSWKGVERIVWSEEVYTIATDYKRLVLV